MENIHKKIFVISFVVVLVFLPIATFIFMPRNEDGGLVFSENENRFLEPYEEPDLNGYIVNFFNDKQNNIKSRRFMQSFDEWFADRFVFREDWIILKNSLETAQGKTEINGVFTVQDKLIQAWRDYDGDLVSSALTAMDEFAGRVNAPVSFMLVPTAQEVYGDALPANCEPGNQEAFIRSVYNALENIEGADALAYLVENRDSYIYYRTDHHWSGYGAYWGYYAACGKLGLTPLDLGAFNVEHASSDFRGTLYSLTLNSKITPDVISFYTLSSSQNTNQNSLNAPSVKLEVNTGDEIVSYDSLYFREYLQVKDKYMAFLGNAAPIVEIVSDLENNDKSLLVFKDSYAHSMLPFLVNHYKKITVVDLRQPINVDIRNFVDLDEYDQVLFVYNAVTFSEEGTLKSLLKLNLTKD